ncbi:MAG: CHAT domain-containing protein [bacterium]|nr:CHAT domain-containing protein [bacterium]
MRAQHIHAQQIEQIMGFTAEAQKLDFLETVRRYLHAFLSLVNQYFADDSTVRKDALDVWLQRKGVVLEAQKRFQDALFASDDPDVVKTMQDLALVRTQLTQLAFGRPGKEDVATYQQRFADLKAEKEHLETILSRLSQKFAVNQKVAQADTQQIAAALPSHTALLEFARIPMYKFEAPSSERWQPAHYLAFLVFAGNDDDVRLIDLGDAETIDQTVTAYKNALTASNMRGLERLYDQPPVALNDLAHQVYQRVFAPLRQELGAVSEVFISPDGNLNLIPFEILVDADGRFLIETYSFNYLAAGRDLLAFGALHEQGNPPVLIGDPDFNLSTAPAPNQGDERGEAFTRSATMRGFSFKRLPGTRADVEAIQTLLKEQEPVLLYMEQAAQEAELRNHPSPRILHLATHGFFLADQDISAFVSPVRGEMLTFTQQPAQPARPFAQFENPLLRSGLALAGANTAGKQEGATEGIVTAEKILGLQLQGTELVVLSACETGMGEVQAGEGVFGLRRAFTQAGTKSLVMSLWSVPDKETQELMVQFYQNLLAGKLNRREALRQAALHQMEVITARYGKPLPYYWGAFVFLGEP